MRGGVQYRWTIGAVQRRKGQEDEEDESAGGFVFVVPVACARPAGSAEERRRRHYRYIFTGRPIVGCRCLLECSRADLPHQR